MNLESIITLLGGGWQRVKELISSDLRSDVHLLQSINDSLVANSGKMLRPMISLLVANAIGAPEEDSYRFAAASEMLHNATLMHDDVADSSQERRGRPTVSALLGPSGAVLVGDFWLARAVEMVLCSEHYDKVVRLFSKTLTDLAEGEMFQMEKAQSADTTEDDYFRIIRCKTASLFEAAGGSAAYSVGASPEMVQAAKDYSVAFGIAFQIKDDILDYAGTDVLGKPTGVDLKEQKITLPLLGAMQASGEEQRWRGMVREISSRPENAEELRSFVMENGGIDYASSVLDSYVDKAVSALAAFPDTPYKEALASLAHFNALRQV